MHSLTCLGKVCSDDASKNKCLDILCRVMYSVVQAPISTPFFFFWFCFLSLLEDQVPVVHCMNVFLMDITVSFVDTHVLDSILFI